ncbi:MAG: amidohydrolase family protein, partial [Candidatus Pacebacteria bacterium]|nr:amidohydrolase family protein [Candidatus Paceibacterota bacterium]
AAHLLNEHLNRLGTRGFGFREAVLVGGPSKSAVWPDIIAEITGLELTVGSEHAGAKGAAMLAEIGTRVYQSKENTGTGSDGISTAPAPVTDKSIYDKELRDFLPPKIFDAHVHLFDRSCLKPSAQFAAKNTYEKFGGVFSKEQYLQWIERLFPEQQYRFNSFGTPSYDSDLDASAAYTGTVSDNQRFFGMALISPHDTLEAIRHRVETNRLIGYKPYLRFVDWKEPNDVTIHDMLTHEHMQFADERGLAITLHIPRSQRLADPLNQTQMVELCRRYPDTKIIFAHIGRAYYLRNVLGFLDGIAQCPNAYVDTAMVNHEGVLEYTFTHFPRERILFGSDAPIAFLYGKSVEINNQYAYLMAEDYEIGTSIYDAKAAVNFTTFYYEQLRGIKLAAERAGLSRNDVEGVFFNNADRLFRQVADRNYAKKIGRRPRPK